MTGELLQIEDRGRVRILTINRPDQLNAFNDALYNLAIAALAAAAEDPGVAVAVITGRGRAFSAGQDLDEMADERDHEQRVDDGARPFMATIEAFPKPLVAAVNGIGVGIGLTMLPHCDLVLIADDARLRAPFASLGVCPEAASSLLLPATVGWAAAAHLLYTASWLDAARAVEIGLAWRAVPAARLIDETMALADRIAQMPIPSLMATKKLLLAARLEAVGAARAREDAAFAQLVGGPANREAIAAFREKRPADFTKV